MWKPSNQVIGDPKIDQWSISGIKYSTHHISSIEIGIGVDAIDIHLDGSSSYSPTNYSSIGYTLCSPITRSPSPTPNPTRVPVPPDPLREAGQPGTWIKDER